MVLAIESSEWRNDSMQNFLRYCSADRYSFLHADANEYVGFGTFSLPHKKFGFKSNQFTHEVNSNAIAQIYVPFEAINKSERKFCKQRLNDYWYTRTRK